MKVYSDRMLLSMNMHVFLAVNSNFREEGINDTFEIIKNGPIILKCDKVVKLSLDRRSRNIGIL